MASIVNTFAIKLDNKEYENNLEKTKKLQLDYQNNITKSLKDTEEAYGRLREKESKYAEEKARLQQAGKSSRSDEIKAVNAKIAANKTMMAEQKKLSAELKRAEKVLDGLFAKKIKSIEATKAQTEALSQQAKMSKRLLQEQRALDKPMKGTSGKTTSWNTNDMKAYYSGLEKESNKATKATNRNTVATKKSAKAHRDIKNDIIRHMRQIGTLVGAYYALTRAYQSTIGTGLDVNKMMEDNTSGIAALLSANTQMALSNGKIATSYEKFVIGQKVAAQSLNDLREASIKTYATFPQLTALFQQVIGHTLGMGKSFGETTDEIIKNTITLTQRMSNLGGATGMEMRKVQEEIRSLISGNVSTDSLLAILLFGSPTKANKALRDAKERGANGVKDMLDRMLKPFDVLADVDAYTRSLLDLEDAWSQTMEQMSKPVFDDLKVIFKELSKDIRDNREEIVQYFADFYEGSKKLIGIADEVTIAFIAWKTIPKILKASEVGLASLNTTMRASSSGATVAARAIKSLGSALKLTARASAPMIAVLAIYEAYNYLIADQAETEEKLLGILDRKNKELEKLSKNQAKYNLTLIEQQIQLKRELLQQETAARYNTGLEGKVKRENLKKEILELRQLQKEYKAVIKVKEQSAEEGDGKLQTEVNVDLKALGESQAILNNAKSESLKITEEIAKIENDISVLRGQYKLAKTEEKRSMILNAINVHLDAQKVKEGELAELRKKTTEEIQRAADKEIQRAADKEKKLAEDRQRAADKEKKLAEDRQKAFDAIVDKQKKRLEEIASAAEALRSEILAIDGSEIDNMMADIGNKMSKYLKDGLSNEEVLRYYEASMNEINKKISDKDKENRKKDIENLANEIENIMLTPREKAADKWTDLLKNITDSKRLNEASKAINKEFKKIKILPEDDEVNKFAKEFGDVFGAIFTNALAEVSTEFLFGDDATSLTKGFTSESINSAMKGNYISAGVNAAGAVISDILGDGQGDERRVQRQIDANNKATDRVVKELESQSKLLVALGKEGSALETNRQILDKNFNNAIENIFLEFEHQAADWSAKVQRKGLKRFDEFVEQFANGDILVAVTNMEEFNNGVDDLGVAWDKYNGLKDNELEALQGKIIPAVNDYVTQLVLSADTIIKSSRDLENLYESYTGNTVFTDKRFGDALSDIGGNQTLDNFDTFLLKTIDSLAYAGIELKKVEEELTGNDLEKQALAARDLSDALGLGFDLTAEQALNYIDSIKLVGDAYQRERDRLQEESNNQYGQLLNWNKLMKDYESQSVSAANNIATATNRAADAAKNYVDSLKTQESALNSVISSVQNTIDTLRGGTDSSYGLSSYVKSMEETQRLSADMTSEAFAESLKDTLKYASSLSNNSNFRSRGEAEYARLLAANELEKFKATAQTDLDVLKLILEKQEIIANKSVSTANNTKTTSDIMVLTGATIGSLDTSIISLNGEIQALHSKDFDIELGQSATSAMTDFFDENFDLMGVDFSEWLNSAENEIDINNDGIVDAIKSINALGERFVELDIDGDGIMDVRLVYDQAQNLIGIETNTSLTASSLESQLWTWANANKEKPKDSTTYTTKDYKELYDISMSGYNSSYSMMKEKYDTNKSGGLSAAEYRLASKRDIEKMTTAVDAVDFYATMLANAGLSGFDKYTKYSENWAEYRAKYGFKEGGYTGDYPIDRVVGSVHGGEYVINARTTKDLGLNNNSGGVMKAMLEELKAQRKENNIMYTKLIGIQKENVNTNRAILREQQQA